MGKSFPVLARTKASDSFHLPQKVRSISFYLKGEVYFEIWAKKGFYNDQCLFKGTLKVSDFSVGKSIEKWFDIKPSKGEKASTEASPSSKKKNHSFRGRKKDKKSLDKASDGEAKILLEVTLAGMISSSSFRRC